MMNLLFGALAGLAYLLFTSSGNAKKAPGVVVQTAQVGDNLYTVTRMGNGQYVVVLTSIKGSLANFPVSVLLDQTGIKQEFGDSAQLQQLKADLGKMNVDFSS
jgi:hypothetical protein